MSGLGIRFKRIVLSFCCQSQLYFTSTRYEFFASLDWDNLVNYSCYYANIQIPKTGPILIDSKYNIDLINSYRLYQ